MAIGRVSGYTAMGRVRERWGGVYGDGEGKRAVGRGIRRCGG